MTVSTIRHNILKTLNSVKTKKQYLILPYTKVFYTIIKVLKFNFIKRIYVINNYILLYFEYTYSNASYIKIKVKFFDIKDKKNYYTAHKLKKISYLYGIISTSKGFHLLSDAVKLKEGGVLLCIFKLN